MENEVFYNRDTMYENIPNREKKLIKDVEELKTNGIPDIQARKEVADLSETVGDQSSKIDILSKRMNGTFNLAEFNVIGDGITDDTASIQSVIDKVNASGGGKVLGDPNKVYAIAGSVKLKSNVILDLQGSTLKRVGTNITKRILENANFGSSILIDKNITVQNLVLEGTGNTAGVNDQGSGLGLFMAKDITIKNVKTKNTNGDGIQWRKADNVVIRDVEIGDFGRNGISPTSGLNAVWDNVIVSGNPITGANPGKDIDAETNKPSSEEKGTNFANNIQCKNITLVDFYTPDGGDFSQEWLFNNCKIGDSYRAFQVKSTSKTIARNIVITSNCVISGAGTNGSAIMIDNVSGVKIASPAIRVGTATGNASGISILNTVDSLDISGVDLSSFAYGIQSYGTARMNNSVIRNVKGKVYLGGSNNKFSSCDVPALVVNGQDSAGNVFDSTTKIDSITVADSGNIISQDFGGARGTKSKSFYSVSENVPDGTTFDMVVPLPSGATRGRVLLLFAGYSHTGRIDHWAELVTTLRIGSTENAVAQEISKAGTKDIAVVAVTNTSVTLRLTYQYVGTFSATVLG
jgi:hypothetical protein